MLIAALFLLSTALCFAADVSSDLPLFVSGTHLRGSGLDDSSVSASASGRMTAGTLAALRRDSGAKSAYLEAVTLREDKKWRDAIAAYKAVMPVKIDV